MAAKDAGRSSRSPHRVGKDKELSVEEQIRKAMEGQEEKFAENIKTVCKDTCVAITSSLLKSCNERLTSLEGSTKENTQQLQ